MNRRSVFPIIAAFCAFASTAVGQEAPSAEITIRDAVRIAIERSTELQRAVIADQSSELNVAGARAGRLPTISASASPSQQYGLTFDQTTGSLASQTVESMNLGLGLDMRLYDGRRTRYSVVQAELQRDAARVGVERTEQQVALDVAQKFLQLLLDRELVLIQEAQLQAAVAQLEQVTVLVDGGARPRGDVIAQDALVAERRGAFIEAQGAVARDESTLVQAIGLDPLVSYTFVGPSLVALEAAGALRPQDVELAELLDAAYSVRPDLRAQALRIDAADAAVGIARSGKRPSLDLGASIGTGYSSLQRRLSNPNAEPQSADVTLPDGTPVLLGGQPFSIPLGGQEFESTPIFSQLTNNRSGRIGLTLSVPIFDRYQTRRAVAEAQIQADDQRLQLETLKRQVAADVQQSAVEVDIARARLESTEAQVSAAAAALQVERDRYAAGSGTLYTVAEVQARSAQALASRAQAAYGLVFRVALVRLAIGDVDVEQLASELLGSG